ncbi:iron-sulfur cluster carrier protein ApbC [Zavarzinia compransoris]|uniref:Iron-sulfur cluster carrier protein n=1 Tax=Zavarzinia compransoris TaxID=1264899 RepID=A0A317E7X3_9PROT|nr:iron-sulfur cluster carrier protein ApbC [Zavarzinia compransoris]PWR22356.1 iron-sulfur cluster carrier protein ApbC [Zavarzinia compransoris]TDP46876.1 ATP-binding protein involved in chromosome partitioning [Zavarzinia compransoris]
MTTATRDEVIATLARISDPDSGKDVVAAGLISGLVLRDGHVAFSIEIDPAKAAAREPLRAACERAVMALPGVLSVTAVLTAHRAAPPAPPRPDTAAKPLALPGVGKVIAVASGKGGVGKSTTAVNLALGLQRLGLKVGLLDADIYGPSIPRMLGLTERPRTTQDKKLIPLEAFGLKAMSIGLMVPEDQAVIWRGPMVMSALSQLLNDVAWAPLDILVIDLPPGTGDAQLTLSQRAPLAGAVIVSTPQDIALIDARKGLAMFEKVAVPVLGIVENMSYFLCPHCHGRSDIFAHGGAHETADRLGVPFLGEVPLHIAIREHADAGRPIVAAAPDSAEAGAYLAIARRVLAGLEQPGHHGRAAPRIVIG